MGTVRLYIHLPKARAYSSFAKLEAGFEEEAWPLALNEIDEINEIYEIALYLEASDPYLNIKDRLCHLCEFSTDDVCVEILPDIDWVRHALDGLSPVRVARFFVHGSHDRDKVRPHDVNIEIDAGEAFGTGHHGTTCGCLEMMSRLMRIEKLCHVADIGTGSGVLAIAAAKCRVAYVLASDIDPIATRVARENQRRGKVAQTIETITAKGVNHRKFKQAAPFDLIVANILARPLMQLAPLLRPLVRRGGAVILSGLLDSQRDSVLAAFRNQGFYHHASLHVQGWATLHLKRKN